MGVLDDAIKAHLELKRKHGAPDEEVAAQEAEALGPVRREVARPAEDAEADAVPEGEAVAAAEPELDALPEAEPVAEAEPEVPPLPPEPESDEPYAEAPPPVEPPRLEPAEQPAAVPSDDFPEVLDPLVGEPEPEAPPVSDEETEESEDVLEETPDFLQETPEHDRLWFEQKPPRDFDFD